MPEIVTDTGDYTPVPSLTKPGYLERAYCPNFNSQFIRVTDSGNAYWNPNSHATLTGKTWGTQCGHGYSSRPSWNADMSLLAMEKGLDGSGILYLDGQDYTPLYQYNPGGSSLWHPTDPTQHLWISQTGIQIGSFNPTTNSQNWTKTLTGYDAIQWGNAGKGKPSSDGDIIPVIGQRTSDGVTIGRTYTRSTDTLSSEIDLDALMPNGGENPWGGPEFDLSPDGDVMLVTGCTTVSDCERIKAVRISDETVLWSETVYRHNPGHEDMYKDNSGDQWYTGLSKAGTNAGKVIKRKISDGAETLLFSEWCSHSSLRATTLEDQIILLNRGGGTGAYTDEAVGYILEGTDAGTAQRYVNMRITESPYLAEGHCSWAPDGKRFVWRSDWGSSGGNIDAYVCYVGAAPPALSSTHRIMRG